MALREEQFLVVVGALEGELEAGGGILLLLLVDKNMLEKGHD